MRIVPFYEKKTIKFKSRMSLLKSLLLAKVMFPAINFGA